MFWNFSDDLSVCFSVFFSRVFVACFTKNSSLLVSIFFSGLPNFHNHVTILTLYSTVILISFLKSYNNWLLIAFNKGVSDQIQWSTDKWETTLSINRLGTCETAVLTHGSWSLCLLREINAKLLCFLHRCPVSNMPGRRKDGKPVPTY